MAARSKSSAKSKAKANAKRAGRVLPPTHPGEFLREDFMKELGLTVYRVATDIGVAPERVRAIVSERRGITGDMALRLSKYFGVSAEFWMNLQKRYELECARDEMERELEGIETLNFEAVRAGLVERRELHSHPSRERAERTR